jgi:hypothetical protein
MTPQPHSGLDRDCLRCLLSRDHARLDALFEQLTAAFDGRGTRGRIDVQLGASTHWRQPSQLSARPNPAGSRT